MRPTTRKNEGAAERGREVLDAAAIVLARQGYEGTSIDDIADELGATKGRVYHYYRSKNDILLGVLDAGIDTLISAVRPYSETTDLPADERLLGMAKAHAMTMMTHHSHQVVTIRTLDRHLGHTDRDRSEAWEEIVRRRREYEQLFIDVVTEGRDAHIFSTADPRLTVRGLLGALNWITVWFDPSTDPTDKTTPAQIADELAHFVLAGALNRRTT